MNNMSNDISSSLLNQTIELKDDNIIIEMDNLINNNDFQNEENDIYTEENDFQNKNNDIYTEENDIYIEDNDINEGDILEIEQRICRICLVEYDTDELISPCKCSGTSKYVHKECLQMWIEKSSNQLAKKQCMECKYEYQYKTNNTNQITKKCDKIKCVHYDSFNIFFKTSYVCLYFLNFLCGYIIYQCDTYQLLYYLEANNTSYIGYIIYGFYGSIVLLLFILLYGIIGCFFCRRCLNYQLIIDNMECDCLTYTYFVVLGICIVYNEIFGLIILIPAWQSKLLYLYNNEYARTNQRNRNIENYNVEDIEEVIN